MARKQRRRPRAAEAARSAVVSSARGRLAAVFVTAAVLRLAVALSLSNLPLVRTPKLDAAEYVLWARQMAGGHFAWSTISPHGPGYPLFLAAIFAMGGSAWAAVIVQSLCAALTAVFIARLGERWFDTRAGIYAGLLYATFGPAVYVETSLLAEGTLICLLMAAIAVLSVERVTPRVASIAGVLFGAAILVRPTAILVLGAVVVAVWSTIRIRRAVVIAALVGSFCLVLAPALVANWEASRTLGVQGYGGLNFYIGNSPLHNGRAVFRVGGGWDALTSEALRAGITDPPQQDRYYIAKTRREIQAHPVAFVKLLAVKALWLLQADEVRDTHSFYFFAEQSPLLAALPRMAVLVPLAFVGMFVLGMRRAAPPLLIAYTVGAALGVVLLVVGTRYRLPIVPSYAILGGLGVSAFADAWRRRDRRQWATMLVVCGIGIVLSHVLRDRSSENLAEEWALTGGALVSEHSLPQAEAAYRRALGFDERSALAWDGLGLALYDEHRSQDARAAFERANRLDSINAGTAYHLALVDEGDGRLDEAVAHLRRSLAIDPTQLDAARHLASDLVQRREDAAAIPVLQGIVAHAPDDAEAHRALAGALGGTGRLAEAERELTLTTGLTPGNGEAWLDRCLLSLDLGQTTDAVAACQRATELGVSSERMRMAQAAIAARWSAAKR
jgi:tetratricopeptide (TPR) repeat protein